MIWKQIIISFFVCQVLADKLQQNVLEFTQKMHSSEVERKKLRAELTDLQRGRSQKNDEQVTVDFKMLQLPWMNRDDSCHIESEFIWFIFQFF